MSLVTKGSKIIIDSFRGLTEVLEETAVPSDYVTITIGGIFTRQKTFERLGGKMLIDNNTYGSVLSFSMLAFRDQSPLVLTHSSAVYAITTSVSNLIVEEDNADLLEALF